MAADVRVMQGARASAAFALTKSAQNIPVSAPKDLRKNHMIAFSL